MFMIDLMYNDFASRESSYRLTVRVDYLLLQAGTETLVLLHSIQKIPLPSSVLLLLSGHTVL